MTQITPTRDEAVPTGWRYSINYGPDGEENFANVYAADGQFVGNLRTHHAIAICNAFAVCEKLAYAPAPASGGVAAVVAEELAIKIVLLSVNWLRDSASEKEHEDYVRANWTKEIAEAKRLILASLSPAAMQAPAVDPNVERLLTAAKAAKRYLEPDLVEPGRTVFWNLVSAINAMDGKP